MPGKGAVQGAQGGHRHEQIAELERPQDQQHWPSVVPIAFAHPLNLLVSSPRFWPVQGV
jgi:hypothetical protein